MEVRQLLCPSLASNSMFVSISGGHSRESAVQVSHSAVFQVRVKTVAFIENRHSMKMFVHTVAFGR